MGDTTDSFYGFDNTGGNGSTNPDYVDQLLNGTGDGSDWVLNNGDVGNPYIASQTAQDVVSNGAVTAKPSPGTNSATGGQAATATTVPPSWLTPFQNIFSAGTQAATTIAPIVNGQPGAPANPGAKPAANGTVAPGKAGAASSSNLLMIGAAVVLGFLLLRRK